jgi:hypothetical protein
LRDSHLGVEFEPTKSFLPKEALASYDHLS